MPMLEWYYLIWSLLDITLVALIAFCVWKIKVHTYIHQNSHRLEQENRKLRQDNLSLAEVNNMLRNRLHKHNLPPPDATGKPQPEKPNPKLKADTDTREE